MLKNAVLQAVGQAKVAAGDLLITATLVHRAIRTHVPGVAPRYDEEESDCQLAHTRYLSKEVDGDRIRATDYNAILFHTTTVPDVDDIVVWSEGSYRIISIDKIVAGDTVAASQVQLRLK